MLYITTRDSNNISTMPKSLKSDCGSDGGLYLPFRMPCFTQDQLNELTKLNFGQCAAQILNVFFSRGITGWDVEFAIGRHPVKVKDIRNNILVCELWHNSSNAYECLEKVLSDLVRETESEQITTSWLRIAIRVAVLFGIYTKLLRSEALMPGCSFDAAIAAGDFSCVMALWYARSMGLPVENIICADTETGALWDLLHLGQVRTEQPLPEELERLICGVFGTEEARRYADVCACGGLYTIPEQGRNLLRSGLFAAVVSAERSQTIIPNVYATAGYVMGPQTALGYGALLDFRTKNRENRPALLIADRSPVCDGAYTANAMHLTLSQLKELI